MFFSCGSTELAPGINVSRRCLETEEAPRRTETRQSARSMIEHQWGGTFRIFSLSRQTVDLSSDCVAAFNGTTLSFVVRARSIDGVSECSVEFVRSRENYVISRDSSLVE